MEVLFHNKYTSLFFWHQLYKGLVLCEPLKASKYDLAEKLEESKWGRRASIGWLVLIGYNTQQRALCIILANGRVLWPFLTLTVSNSAYKNQVRYSQSSCWHFPWNTPCPPSPWKYVTWREGRQEVFQGKCLHSSWCGELWENLEPVRMLDQVLVLPVNDSSTISTSTCFSVWEQLILEALHRIFATEASIQKRMLCRKLGIG